MAAVAAVEFFLIDELTLSGARGDCCLFADRASQRAIVYHRNLQVWSWNT
jgi:hypothetical protein